MPRLADAVLSAGAVGAVAGCADSGESFLATGTSAGDEPLTKTIFEAGSITKTVTALLLAQLVSDEVLSLDDTLGTFLPEATGEVANIRLEEIATHTAGLPRLPPNLRNGDFDRSNPYAHFGEEQMHEALKQTEIGDKTYQYSNYGYGLLGMALASATHQQIDVAMKERILHPLGLNETYLAIGAVPNNRDAIGHDIKGIETSHWDFTPQMAGCGAIRTTIVDLLRFAQYMSETEDRSIDMLLKPRAEREKGVRVGLAWIMSGEACWHTGGTGGFGAFVGFIRNKRRAVAILANSSHEVWRPADGSAMNWLAGRADG